MTGPELAHGFVHHLRGTSVDAQPTVAQVAKAFDSISSGLRSESGGTCTPATLHEYLESVSVCGRVTAERGGWRDWVGEGLVLAQRKEASLERYVPCRQPHTERRPRPEGVEWYVRFDGNKTPGQTQAPESGPFACTCRAATLELARDVRDEAVQDNKAAAREAAASSASAAARSTPVKRPSATTGLPAT